MTQDERNGRRLTRTVGTVVLIFLGVLVVVAKVSPEQDTYTSNADAPMVTWTLTPREPTTTTEARKTTTTLARMSSAVSVEKVLDEIVIVDGRTVYRVPRSPAVMIALYILLENTK